MEFRRLGRSGVQVSTLGLGTNNFGSRMDEEQSARVLHQALDLGVNFIDTSNSYGSGCSEEFIGAALEGHRHRVILATKVGFPVGGGVKVDWTAQKGRILGSPVSGGVNQQGVSRNHIMQQVEISLKRLKTDYIDLYQIHFPDPNTLIEETLRAMGDLLHQGKIRYIGCTNFAAWQVCEAVWTSRTLNLASFVTVQTEYSLLSRDIERDLVPFCQAYQIGIIPHSPLASGLLTGKYRFGEPVPQGTRFANVATLPPGIKDRYMTERNLALVDRLERFARERGHTVGDLAIAWLLSNPLVCSVIAGAMKPEQVMANAKGAEWHLTSQDVSEVKTLLNKEG